MLSILAITFVPTSVCVLPGRFSFLRLDLFLNFGLLVDVVEVVDNDGDGQWYTEDSTNCTALKLDYIYAGVRMKGLGFWLTNLVDFLSNFFLRRLSRPKQGQNCFNHRRLSWLTNNKLTAYSWVADFLKSQNKLPNAFFSHIHLYW